MSDGVPVVRASRWKGRGRPPRLISALYDILYSLTVAILFPANAILALLRKDIRNDRQVLHIGGPVHVLYHSVQALKCAGVKADFLAIGESASLKQWDHHFIPSVIPMLRVLQEFRLVWTVVAKYDIIHAHVMTTATKTGWELPFLKSLGRKVVIHFRGCEARDRDLNLRLFPVGSICENCDYGPHFACQSKRTTGRRRLSRKYGDAFLVTTPDMLDFVPNGTHLPFFTSESAHHEDTPHIPHNSGDVFRIFHVTTHPGIEGTEEIRAVIESLNRRGYSIELVFLQNVPHEVALEECSRCDMAIGKMKMGYYANAQIESMLLGVPTITHVRDEFMTDELRESGFILTDMAHLEQTIEYYLTHPAELETKRQRARVSILQLHDNEVISRQLSDIYEHLSASDDEARDGGVQ